MKNLKFYVAILLALLVMPIVTAAGNVDISVAKYDPYPAEPGRYIDLWIKVENTGSGTASDVVVRLDPKFPFDQVNGEPIETQIGSMSAGAVQIVKYRLSISANAVQGDNYIDVFYKYDSFTEIAKRFDISVQTSDAVLAISKMYKPEQIRPGSDATITIEVQNLADSFFKNVNAKLDFSGVTAFAPESATEQRIYTINSGEIKNITFNVAASPSAEGGIYAIPLRINYSDSVGNTYTSSEIISLRVGDTPNLEVFTESGPIKAGALGNVNLKLVNLGLVNLKLVTIRIQDSKDYTISSARDIYVGTLDSDDSNAFEVSLIPKSAKTFDLSMEVQFLDANNNEYTRQFSIPVTATNGSLIIEALQTIVVIGVLGAAGYFVYRKFVLKKPLIG